ncbi:M55 family metallopeptidase [candidate division KSB1 bacterium]
MKKTIITIIVLSMVVVLSATISLSQQNLKVFISVDMEGICGVVNSDHVSTTGKDYNRATQWMTDETNAAIQGALDAGANEIVVNDSHGGMRNILIEKLNSAADLISGSPKPLSMMQGIDETFDAVVFIGYHAGMGTENGVLDHTMSSAKLVSVRVNGKIMNEASLNAAIAGYYNVPVVFVSGDMATSKQVHEYINPNIVTAVVKEAIGRRSARNISPQKAQNLIREGVKKGIQNRTSMPIYNFDQPVELEMHFFKSEMIDNATLIPGVERISGSKVKFTHPDYITVFKVMRALLILADG